MAVETQQQTVTVPTRKRFNLDEYHRMIETGVLSEGARIELIGGEVIEMSAVGVKHSACVGRFTRLFVPLLTGTALVRIQQPISVPHWDEPEPDVAVVQMRDDDYGFAHPGPADVFLVIEVSDSSLGYDRGIKRSLYARAGIPESWVVDLNGDGIERSSNPDRATGAYRRTVRFGRGETVGSLALPAIAVSVDAVLGPSKRAESA